MHVKVFLPLRACNLCMKYLNAAISSATTYIPFPGQVRLQLRLSIYSQPVAYTIHIIPMKVFGADFMLIGHHKRQTTWSDAVSCSLCALSWGNSGGGWHAIAHIGMLSDAPRAFLVHLFCTDRHQSASQFQRCLWYYHIARAFSEASQRYQYRNTSYPFSFMAMGCVGAADFTITSCLGAFHFSARINPPKGYHRRRF